MKVKGKVEAFFGPGYQWGADTNEDCWVLVIQNDSTIVRPWVVIHGTTGEVLYWQYTDQTTGCAYLNVLPTEGQLSYEDAVALAKNRFLQAMNEPSSITWRLYTSIPLEPIRRVDGPKASPLLVGALLYIITTGPRQEE